MRILFLSLLNIENIDDSGIYTDLVRGLRDEGHKITVIGPYEKRENKKTSYFKKEEIQFLQIKIDNITKVNAIKKGISILTLEHNYLKAIKKYIPDEQFDLILYTTPPITFEKVIRYLKNKNSEATTYLLLKDIFPQNAVDLGYLKKNGLIYRYFRMKEKRLYLQSDQIGCMTKNNVDYILNHNSYLSKEKLEICPNTLTPINLKNTNKEINLIRNRYEIPIDKTLFMYGGNLGKPQGIDFLCEILKMMSENHNAYFLIVGSGTEFPMIKEFITKNKIKNAKLISNISRNEYDVLVQTADVGLIFLDKRFTIPNFPSRLLSYMQASLPILAATDKNSDLNYILEENKIGYWSESGDIDHFLSNLNELMDSNKRMIMGKESKRFFEKNYSTEQAVKVITKTKSNKEKVV